MNSAPPDSLAGFKGPTSKGRGGRGRKGGKGGEGRDEEKGKGKEGKTFLYRRSYQYH